VDLGALSAISLADANARSHRLGDFWTSAPVVLVFLRHFG
jgi:hypothetical protein